MSTLVLAGRYEIVEKIGDGGMAVVYKARDKLLSRFVAIKILRKEYVFDQTFVENFRNESMAAGSLIHPNIVTIYDVGKDLDINYIVMEYVEGHALSDVIAAEAPLDYKRTISIGKQVASALDLAHRSGIIHRDVKPHNILITEDGTAKITDFGIAKAVSDGTIISESGVIMGSVHYFSPEQSRGQYVDEKTDIYSLGIVLYEMLTGRVPFDADNPVTIAVMHMNDTIIPPSRLVTGVPPGLDLIVMKATAKYQSDRFHNIDEMYKALDNVNFITGVIDDPEIAGFVRPIVLTEDTPGRGYSNSAAVDTESAPPSFDPIREDEFGDDVRYDEDSYHNNEDTDSFYDDDDDDDFTDLVPVKSRVSSRGREPSEKKEGFLAAFSRLDTKYKVIAIAIVVVIALLISIPLQKLFSGANAEYVEVPNVVGLYYEDAQKQLTDLGFNVEAKLQPLAKAPTTPISEGASSLTSDTNSYSAEELANAGASPAPDTTASGQINFREGMVMEQDPVGGSQAKYGYKIKLDVAGPPESSGEIIEPPAVEDGDPVEVPNLIGLSKANAQKAIQDAGFRLGTVRYEASDAPIDSVIAQTPKNGEMLVPGMSVSFTVSTGPRVVEVTVPSVVGKTRAEAEAALANARLTVNVTDDYSNTYAEGLVAVQYPGQGAVVEEGSTVTITVSKGPNAATVPNVSGGDMNVERAKAAIEDAGLTFGGATSTVNYDQAKDGIVYDQTLPAGITVARGEVVSVLVYIYQAPTTYTVTYAPGDHGTFTAVSTGNLLAGAATPGAPTPTGEAGWDFAGWSPGIAPTVSDNATYTATWTPTPTSCNGSCGCTGQNCGMPNCTCTT
jgi:serine/threonine-protein kinase